MPAAAPALEVAVPCHVVDRDDRHVLVAVGWEPAYLLVRPHQVRRDASGGTVVAGRVSLPLGWPLAVAVPGLPVDGHPCARTLLAPGPVAPAGASHLQPPAPLALPAPASRPVAFLVATKNGERTVGDTVRSAVTQGPVYVVSDGSDDATVAVAEAAGAVVLHLERNVGKPTALRAAVHHFGLTRRYEAIAILDDDTVVDDGFASHCWRAMEPGVVIAVGRTLTRWGDEFRWNLWIGSRAYAYWRYQTTLRQGQSALNVMSCISGSNSVYRSSLLDEVLVERTPYIVDDTYWTLETHRRRLGRIVYVPQARAHICDPTNFRDWYRQNLRWMWGTFQGVVGHRIGTRATLFDATYVLQILDWLLYVVIAPVLVLLALWKGWVEPATVAAITFLGYTVGAVIGAAALRKWRLACMGPALIVVDWLYRAVFVHAFFRTVRQPRVESCRWDSPTRYV